MKIIKGIKIKNFRSFIGEKDTITDLKDFNIFSGSNDCGKSNIFRALNLFFNDEISPGIYINMDRDFSIQKSHKTHKIIEITIDFELTTEGSTYLSKNFSIQKIFYRDNSYKYIFFYKKEDGSFLKISSNSEENIDKTGKSISDEKKYRKQFNEFLGKIKFEYVPAIREPQYFSNLFGRIINKIKEAENERIQIIDNFINELENPKKAINDKESLIKTRQKIIDGSKLKKGTEEYSDEYKQKMSAVIEKIQKDIENLKDNSYVSGKLKELNQQKEIASNFQGAIKNLSEQINGLSSSLFGEITFLDSQFTIVDNLFEFFKTFEIGTGKDKNISLKSRGDGMQSKYIPHMLDFLSKVQKENEKGDFSWEQESNKYFIWGFEEPENSYEYINSIRLSNNFVGISNFIKNEKGEKIEEVINYSKDKQIFITTHSEEFLRLFNEKNIKSGISLYLVEKQEHKEYGFHSQIKFITESDLDNVHNNLGLKNIARSKLISDIKSLEESYLERIKVLTQEIEDQKLEADNIKKELSLIGPNGIIIFCENQNAYDLNKLKFKNINFIASSNKIYAFDTAKNKENNSVYALIDRDFLTDNEKKYIEVNTNVRLFEFYCYENYLYHPENLREYYISIDKDFDIISYTQKIIEEVQKIDITDIGAGRQSYKIITDYTKSVYSYKDFDNIKSSTDFNDLYKFFSMKKHCTELNERQNIQKTKLSQTNWFKNKIKTHLISMGINL